MNELDTAQVEGPGVAHAVVWGGMFLLFAYATAFIAWKMVNASADSARVEIGASYFGVVGTLLLATRSRWAGWGFVAFLASNAGWLWFSLANGHEWMFWQQVAFTISSVLGICVWLLNDWWLAIGASVLFAFGGDALEDTGDGL